MKYVFLGVTPRTLASGRPLVFGDELDVSDLTPEDEALRPLLAEVIEEAPPAPDPEPTPDPEA